MEIQTLTILVAIGLAAGILSGLVGVGGGIILVPSLVYFMHYGQHQAQGTSLGVLCLPVVILAFLAYYRESRAVGAPIDFKVIAILAAGFIVGGFIGGKVAVKIDETMLRRFFAVLLFYTGIKMLHWDDAAIRWLKNIFS